MSNTGDFSLREVLNQRIGTHVKRLDQFIMTAKTDGLRPLGLTVPQYATLFAIQHLQPTSGAQLAREALLTQQTMSTTLANLQSNGLVTRESSQVHQKLILVRLTPAGEQLLEAANVVAVRIEAQLRAAITEDDFVALERISTTITSQTIH